MYLYRKKRMDTTRADNPICVDSHGRSPIVLISNFILLRMLLFRRN